MNKQERIIVGLLFALLVGWIFLFPPPPPTPPAATEEAAPEAFLPADDPAMPAPAAIIPAPPDVKPDALPEPVAAREESEVPPQDVVLEDELLRVTFTSRGAAIREAQLRAFRRTLEPDSDAKTLAFPLLPPLALPGLAAFGPEAAFAVTRAESNRVVFSRETATGVAMIRTVTLLGDYRMSVVDAWTNGSATVAEIADHRIQLGEMALEPHLGAPAAGLTFLGVDTLSARGGERVRTWGTKSFFSGGQTLADFFMPLDRRGGGCVSSMFKPALKEPLPTQIAEPIREETAWVAAKSKFFAQILTPADPAPGFVLQANRKVSPAEDAANPRSWASAADIESVSAQLRFSRQELQPGEGVERSLVYYVGPKKQALLKSLGLHQEDVMEFGRLKFICEPLLWLLNAMHNAIPNYGVAIILLTVLIKIVFWPITHKSTDQMKRMAALQPLTKEIQAKYKAQPEKMQREIMQLYKQHKVNPMAGCLPMLVQIPVFIGLFTVLRSAVELRFASFLWISDLSEPEGLFQSFFAAVPFISALNILPLVMTALTVLQQRMTPAAGDPQQQKMMQLMPIIFLFILYNMASGLVLYWTVNQILSIVQLKMQRKHPALPVPART